MEGSIFWTLLVGLGIVGANLPTLRRQDSSTEKFRNDVAYLVQQFGWLESTIPVIMATIEAETNFRNVPGDLDASGEPFAWGFGQVQLRWPTHFLQLEFAASYVGKTMPYTYWAPGEVNRELGQFVLDNPDVSLVLAMKVIHDKWQGSGGDLERFVRMYVGYGVSQEEITRRMNLFSKWGVT